LFALCDFIRIFLDFFHYYITRVENGKEKNETDMRKNNDRKGKEKSVKMKNKKEEKEKSGTWGSAGFFFLCILPDENYL